MAYPVRFEADYAERRSRLTVFFRFILLIPIAIAVFLYAIAASIAVIIAWFAIVITARYPGALYDFMAGYARYLTRAGGYALLLCDPYPPFSAASDPGYPVKLEFAGPLERYSRWKTFFRFILAIPILLLRYVLSVLLEIGAVVAWFVIVITGRLPRGIFDPMAWAISYIARSDTYVLLLTETYPPFEESEPPGEEARPALAGAPPALAEAEAQPPAEESEPAAAEEQPFAEAPQAASEEPQPESEEPQAGSEETQAASAESQPSAEPPPTEESQP